MIQRANETSQSLEIDKIYGELENTPAMDLIQRTKTNFIFDHAPYINDPNGFLGYLHLIRNLTMVSKKTLYFGEGSQITAVLANMGIDLIPKTTKEAIERFPQIAALGFCLSGMMLYDYNPNEDLDIERLEQEILG